MSISRRYRAASLCLGAAVLAIGAAGVASASAPPPGSGPPPSSGPVAPPTAVTPLRILLTNDDGWEAPGVQAVFAALVAAGHDVVMVAPDENQSGSGARVGFTEPLTLTHQAEGVFSVSGSPADSTEVGLSIAFDGELPDLVIAGSNVGQNIASAEVHSGTVGAAVTALNEGVPAIAVSTEIGEDDYTPTADFTVALVAALTEAAGDGPVLPDDIGLNVNFPILDEGELVAGVAIAATDRSFVDVTYDAVPLPEVGASTEITPALTIIEPVDPEGDAAMLAAGFVTVTFISSDYDAAPPANLDSIGPLSEVITAL